MLLITEYHELGSLRTYLLENTLTPKKLLHASKSIARGLAHLHTEILGVRTVPLDLSKKVPFCIFKVPGKGKPSITHRDFNSKNILMKENGECCISGFGNAAKYDSKTNQIDFSTGRTEVTVR